MKANELRIGNWVYHEPSVNETTNGEFIVSEINVFDKNSINGLESSDVKPIPLTQEWLVKFGFEKRDVLSSVLYDIKNPRFSVYLNPPIDKSNKWNILGIEKNINIQHVHQLQNLYFALTGEELTLKQ